MSCTILSSVLLGVMVARIAKEPTKEVITGSQLTLKNATYTGTMGKITVERFHYQSTQTPAAWAM